MLSNSNLGRMLIVHKDDNFTHAWAGYEYTFMSMGSTHTLNVKSWAGHGYNLVPAGIPIPCLFIVKFLRDTSTSVDL
jgi:hypothetical protein